MKASAFKTLLMDQLVRAIGKANTRGQEKSAAVTRQRFFYFVVIAANALYRKRRLFDFGFDQFEWPGQPHTDDHRDTKH